MTRPVTDHAPTDIVAFIRECHEDCGGCEVELLCDEHEQALRDLARYRTALEQITKDNIAGFPTGAALVAGAALAGADETGKTR